MAKPKAASGRKRAAAKPKKAKAEARVQLGHVAENGISPSLYVLVERGVNKRPRVAKGLDATVEIRFKEDFAPVRIRFEPDQVCVSDADDSGKALRPDLVIEGSLPDVEQLASAPLAGGLPKLTDKRGRNAIGRVARRRVKIVGNPLVARRLLKLLEL